MGIIDKDGNFTLLGLFFIGQHSHKSPHPQSGNNFKSMGQHPDGTFFARLHGGSGERIVEFTGQQIMFRFFQLFGGIGKQTKGCSTGQQLFSSIQLIFQPTVQLFDLNLGGIATHKDGPQILVEHRKLLDFLLQRFKECFRRGMGDFHFRMRFHKDFQFFQVNSGRSAAMVADAPGKQAHRLILLRNPFFCLTNGFTHQSIVTLVQPMCQHGGTVEAFPPEIPVRQIQSFCIRTHKQIALIATLA